jgi:hypothetical protein
MPEEEARDFMMRTVDPDGEQYDPEMEDETLSESWSRLD